MPSLSKFYPYLEKIWESKILTNGGPFHQELEQKLVEYFNVPFVSLFNNATIALITTLKALEIKGEVITTPYSFVATSHAIEMCNLKPKFVDIEREGFNINPDSIERAITEKTTAILAVHCYGQPCDVDKIEKIAQKYSLKTIYDAAHAFGVQCHCGSVLAHGDASVVSFHATKVFNTFEGGAVITKDESTKRKIESLKNFGIIDELTVVDIGLNGKMSEINAAFGLIQLEEIDKIIERRKTIANLYDNLLSNIRGLRTPAFHSSKKHNYSYYPIIIEESFRISRDELYEELKTDGIMSRRYFYPLITEMAPYKNLRPVVENAKKISEQVLCLPIYPDLTTEEVEKITQKVRGKQ